MRTLSRLVKPNSGFLSRFHDDTQSGYKLMLEKPCETAQQSIVRDRFVSASEKH